jgi:hypothetical protein
MSKYEVLGLQKIHCLKDCTKVENYTSPYKDSIKYNILLQEDKTKFKLELESYIFMCFSGYTTATGASMKLSEISNMSLTHVIKKPTYIELDEKSKKCKNEIFEFSEMGDCKYYPEGYFEINMEKFEPTPRAKDRRQVWIFYGNSGLGKSYLADKMSDLIVYETDENKSLPDVIYADIIVKGNKYNFTIEDIKKRLFGSVEINECEFSSNSSTPKEVNKTKKKINPLLKFFKYIF